MLTNVKMRGVQNASSFSNSGKGTEDSARYGRGSDRSKTLGIIKPRIITRSDFEDCYGNSAAHGSSETMNVAGKIVLGITLPEDIRISKLLRRLAAETNAANAIELCTKLKKVLNDPANNTYVRKSFDILAETILGIMKSGSPEWVSDVAEVFGKMGYVVRGDFSIYRGWIMRAFRGSKAPQIYLMRALMETFRLDEEGDLTLHPHAEKVMKKLKEFLEECVVPDLFVAIVCVIEQICRNYPDAVEPFFKDIVDIVVGWHLEIDQSPLVKHHCSRLLQEFRSFWEKEFKFTLSLLGQFVEDIQACGEDWDDESEEPEKCFGSFVGTFNTVIKCIYSTPDCLVYLVGKEMLQDSFGKISSVAKVALIKTTDEEMIIALNEYLTIMIDCYRAELDINANILCDIFEMEIEKLDSFTDEQVMSLLFTILKFFIQMKTVVPFEFIATIMAPESKLLKVRFSKNKRLQKCMIRINQEILNLKNVQILQEAYKFILRDLGVAIKSLPGLKDQIIDTWGLDDDTVTHSYSAIEAEFVINQHLSSLATLATSNSSIIAMWALQPTILDLLSNWMQSTNRKLWSKHSVIHFSIVSLIVCHCQNNHFFITSSTLLKQDDIADALNRLNLQSPSPTSEHFEMILQFLVKIFAMQVCTDTLNLLLDFTRQIIIESSKYSAILAKYSPFNSIIKSVIKFAINSAEEVIMKCAECIGALSEFVTVHPEVLTAIAEACCYHICSNNCRIREKYSYIFSTLPLEYSLNQVNTCTGINHEMSSQIATLQHWLHSSQTSGDLRPDFFKELVNHLGFNKDADFIDDFIKEIFTNCWYTEQGKAGIFAKYALHDVRCLISWAQWETAQFCVNNKLKTPLGKAQDTFIKIEAIIKEDARILALKEKSVVNNTRSLLANQKQARMLLGFLEALEKIIYNAAKGTAFAMPCPEKSVRTFFRVNSATCDEWFSRIRTAVDLVALHCMEAEMVIRYTEEILKRIVKQNKIADPIFDETLMSLAWGLFRTGESDALYGLYNWTKQIANRNILWLKMVAEQTAGKREAAADGYMSILSSDDCPKSIYVQEFIHDQLVLCLFFSYRLPELYDILKREEARESPRKSISTVNINSSQIQAMISYEKNQDVSVLDLSAWETLDMANDVVNDFSHYSLISLAESTLAKVTLPGCSFDTKLEARCFEIIHNCLHECLRTQSREHLNNLTVLNHICHKIVQQKNTGNSDNMRSLCVNKKVGSITLMRILAWSEMLDNVSHTDSGQQNINIRLDMSSMQRKEGNFQFAKQELSKFFKKCDYAVKNNLGDALNVDAVQEKFILPESIADVSIWNENISRGVYETCKLMYCTPKQKNGAIQLASSAALGICNRLKTGNETPQLKERAARILLTLAEWLQLENDTIITSDQNSSLVRLLASLLDITPHPDETTPAAIPIIDASVGKLIQHGIKQCPDLAKAWGALGNWCYKWGRKMVEIRNEDNDKAGLRISDVSAISNIIPNATTEDIQNIVEILNQHHVTPEEEDIDPNETSSTEMIENQLRTLPILTYQSQEHLRSIVDIWKQAHKTVYGYYEIAADAYFKYLQLTTTNEDENEGSGGCSNVTATLRLLRLVVKHALGLQEVLEEGLATTPTSPWRVIIPQLFSRMNHHEPYVRRRIAELICRVAKDAPQLIIFPTVVGAVQGQKTDLADISITSDDPENINNTSVVDSGLICCFNSLLDTLSHQAPECVAQVQLLVSELKRITLLWDELWLVTLAQIYSEWLKRFVSFEQYIQRFKDNSIHMMEKSTIIAGKYSIMLKPVIFVIERLHEMTSRKAETNNERIFQERFMKLIEETIRDLKKPFNAEKPHETWKSFKALFASLQQRSQKKSSSTLKMMDISPVLAQLKDTMISMPGVECGKEPIYIKSVENIIHILPSKTKPKKLVFVGSNGKRYTYLFKSLEDLHLDERIMQFLSIANTMMAKSIDCVGNVSKYRARHYSVIPLGPRSGLINWVDGVVPIFALFKKWQQREAANPKKDGKFPVILRPSEMFYNKLNPLLSEQGIKAGSNRKQWPVPVLTQVLSELSAETPCDLLSKELWCNSTNAAAWRQIIRNYSLSLAVMSVIGYVIGLGDRHLDNILIELSTGEILHIDYNVCFEKGHTLRVPEKVPFRMTQNIEEALGVTGVQGTFWLACEHVLKALKKGRETLLTLLEAFVYDPLVDWAVGEDGAGDLAVAAYGGEALGGELRQARKQLEREVTRDTLAMRFTEIKPDWIHNRDEIAKQLKLIQDHLNDLKKYRNDLQKCETQLDLLSKQMALVREAEALGTAMESHQLGTISQRYSVYKRTRDEFDSAKAVLLKKAESCDAQILAYRSSLDSINNNKMLEYLVETDELIKLSIRSEFDLIGEFLEQTAQGQMYIQCDQARKELDSSLQKQMGIVRQIFETLIQYGSVMKFYPNGQHDNHRCAKYSQWVKYLTEHKSAQSCRDVVMQYHATLGKNAIKPIPERIFSFSRQLQGMIADTNNNLQKTYEKLNREMINMNGDGNYETLFLEYKGAIQIYLKQEQGSERALECVVFTLLCDINKRLLMIENAAASAGENLVDLTSNGKWFLEEVNLLSSVVKELCGVLPSADVDILKTPIKVLQLSSNTYSVLKTMNHRFLSSVLPYAVCGIIGEDKTILEMIATVSNLQQGLLPLPELLANLNLHLRCTILNLPSTNLTSMAMVEELKSKLQALKEHYVQSETVNDYGRDLFLSFNALFDELDVHHKELMAAIDELDVNKNWIKLDQMKDANELAKLVFKKTSRAVIENIFVVKRIDVMIEFFTLCLQIAYAFKGSSMTSIPDNEQFARPLRKYIADYIYRLTLGVGPYSVTAIICSLLERSGMSIEAEINLNDFGAQSKINLEELCHKGKDIFIKSLHFSQLVYNQVSVLCSNLDAAWRSNERVQHFQNTIELQTATVKRLQLLATCHYWLHEDVIASAGVGFSAISRATIILQLKSMRQNLAAWKSTIEKMREELMAFVMTAMQRLKWAAGANPNLVEMVQAFETRAAAKRDQLDKNCLLAAVALKSCTSILSYETMKTDSQENYEQDQVFLNDVSRWEKSCTMAQSCSNAVSVVEEALVELLDPEGPIDVVWLNNVKALLNDMTEQTEEDVNKFEKNVVHSTDNLQKCGHKLRQLNGVHHQLASDVIVLLKSSLKNETEFTRQIKDYLLRYKQFIDTLTEVQGTILSKDFTDENVSAIVQQTMLLSNTVKIVYDDLFWFENGMKGFGRSERENSVSSSSATTIEEAGKKTPKTMDGLFGNSSNAKKNKGSNQTEQKRNAYAVSVWRRIRMKLEGRDPDPTRRCTVQEQVTWMIREAMSTENLAVLYEGWTPWI